MNITQNLCSNALRKVALLITKAANLGMDVSGYGEAGKNRKSGNVYLWLEDCQFSLFVSLGSDEIYANWTDSNNGDEHQTAVGNHTLASLDDWAAELFDMSEKEHTK